MQVQDKGPEREPTEEERLAAKPRHPGITVEADSADRRRRLGVTPPMAAEGEDIIDPVADALDLVLTDPVHDGGCKVEANPVGEAQHRLALAIRHHLQAEAEAVKMRLALAKAEAWVQETESKARHAKDMMISAMADVERRELGMEKSEPEKYPDMERMPDFGKDLMGGPPVGRGAPRSG